MVPISSVRWVRSSTNANPFCFVTSIPLIGHCGDSNDALAYGKSATFCYESERYDISGTGSICACYMPNDDRLDSQHKPNTNQTQAVYVRVQSAALSFAWMSGDYCAASRRFVRQHWTIVANSIHRADTLLICFRRMRTSYVHEKSVVVRFCKARARAFNYADAVNENFLALCVRMWSVHVFVLMLSRFLTRTGARAMYLIRQS